MKKMACSWPSEILANVLKFSTCEDVISMCSTNKECASKCAEAFNWPDFPSERKKLAWNCLLHNIFESLSKDLLENHPPGWMWKAHLTSEVSDLSDSSDMRNLDTLPGEHHVNMTLLHEVVSSDAAIDGGVVVYSEDQNEHVREHFSNVRYGDYFQDPNADDITWVASEPRSITIEWVRPDDELTIFMQVRNPSLRSLVLLAFQLCGCCVLNEESEPSETSWIPLRIPEYALRDLPRTRGARKRYQRTRFLQGFPFLQCHTATNDHDQYIDTIPYFRPMSFAEAMVDYKYVPPFD